MPWKETQKMNQKIEFVMKALNCDNFRELCRDYGISAKTGYKWRERFVEQGLAGMEEQSRRPRSHAKELPEAGGVRDRAPQAGARPLGAAQDPSALRAQAPGRCPSESSFKRVLEKAG